MLKCKHLNKAKQVIENRILVNFFKSCYPKKSVEEIKALEDYKDRMNDYEVKKKDLQSLVFMFYPKSNVYSETKFNEDGSKFCEEDYRFKKKNIYLDSYKVFGNEKLPVNVRVYTLDELEANLDEDVPQGLCLTNTEDQIPAKPKKTILKATKSSFKKRNPTPKKSPKKFDFKEPSVSLPTITVEPIKSDEGDMDLEASNHNIQEPVPPKGETGLADYLLANDNCRLMKQDSYTYQTGDNLNYKLNTLYYDQSMNMSRQ